MSTAVLSHSRGVRDRHKRGTGCGGRGCAFDERRVMRTAKPCGPDASVLASSRRSFSAGDGGKKADHRGARAISRKPLRAGMPDDSGDLAVNTRVHFLLPFCTRGCGCTGRPAFPTPSGFRERKMMANLGRMRRENAKLYPGQSETYCFAIWIENSPLRTRRGRPSTNFATASSP